MDREQLIKDFSGHEVETVEDMLACMPGPPTADKFRRMIMLFLRGHYSDPNNYGELFDHLKCLFYSPIPGEGSLEVGYAPSNDYDNPDAYPGVFVRFGGVKLSRIAIGNFAGTTADTAGTFVSKEAVLLIVVEHVAIEASTAYDLAEMSARVIQAMAHPMLLHSGAESLEVEGYNEPQVKKPEPNKHYTVAMPLKITYTQAVTRLLESHRIRRIVEAIEPTTT